MSGDIFLVIITFGLIFAITAAMTQGLATTVDLLKAGFKGRRQSQVMLLQKRDDTAMNKTNYSLASTQYTDSPSGVAYLNATGHAPQILTTLTTLTIKRECFLGHLRNSGLW